MRSRDTLPCPHPAEPAPPRGDGAALRAEASRPWKEALGRFHDTDSACAASGGVSKRAVSGRIGRRWLLGL